MVIASVQNLRERERECVCVCVCEREREREREGVRFPTGRWQKGSQRVWRRLRVRIPSKS
ncbi:unnamed protein product [Musa acuminata subsp. malaccensis]|uniref:(wild Malaysian banana) hypothetical protein n=1 Tax=Musa acuminata subsp. malaccensis TaxID=214687 RepID=A0A8D6ZTW7_MUSAM|nr:unnamed protein product [Musa acuminata subsp. malaccensis]